MTSGGEDRQIALGDLAHMSPDALHGLRPVRTQRMTVCTTSGRKASCGEHEPVARARAVQRAPLSDNASIRCFCLADGTPGSGPVDDMSL